MLTKRESNLSKILIVVQVILSVLVFIGLDVVYPIRGNQLNREIFFISQIIIIWGYFMTKFRLGVIFREYPFLSMVRGYLAMVSVAGFLLIIELYIIHRFVLYYKYDIIYFLLFLALDFIVLIIFKYLLYNLMRFLRRKGFNSRKVVIVGDENTLPFIETFKKVNDWGYQLSAIASPSEEMIQPLPNSYFINSQSELETYYTKNVVDDIFYCLSVNDTRFNLQQIIKSAEEIGVTVHIMQENVINDIITTKVYNSNVHGQFHTHRTTPSHYFLLKIKETSDIVFSALVLTVVSPLLFLIGLLIKLEDGGPVFFKQERIGLNGRRFYCFKFRSMVMNAEDLLENLQDKNESDGPTFKIENDPRITKIGLLLRKTSLDELPQFYNVLKGEMSVVGPRPPLLKEVEQYERSQLRRLSMRPGITCIWQVSGRNSLSFKQWMELDLKYIDSWSLWLDFKIIIKTVAVVFKANGK